LKKAWVKPSFFCGVSKRKVNIEQLKGNLELIIYKGMNDILTIVIPCKNEGWGIIDVLSLLGKQDLRTVIIVADSSNNNTTYLLRQYSASNNPYLQIVPGGFPAEARNNGAMRVTTPYVLFMDADIYLNEPDLLSSCLELAKSGDYDLVTCKFKTTTGKYNWVYRMFDFFQWISSKTKPFAVGGFMLFKTETFKKLNGFNEEDKIAEDYHLSSKINPKKFKIINRYVHTPDRRFSKKGVYYMIKLAWKSWLNRNNEYFFKKDYNYWS